MDKTTTIVNNRTKMILITTKDKKILMSVDKPNEFIMAMKSNT